MRFSELEAELGKEWVDEMVIAATRQRLGLGLKVLSAKEELPLECDELIQRQPATRQICVAIGFGEMQQTNCPGARRQGSAEEGWTRAKCWNGAAGGFRGSAIEV